MTEAPWWIAAQGRAWGPYPATRLPAFAAQGRLGPESQVGRAEAGPFARAADTPELASLFGGEAERTFPREAPGTGAGAPAEVGAVADRTVLVVGDASEDGSPAFETALRGHGEAVCIRHGLWLLRTAATASELRNALSRPMRGAAMLLVVEAPLARAAWFNLDGGTDRALRRLWTDG